ncbi:pyridoxamine 5'-phosphate oxidase family protein [Szabonella alba]|uniref:Pyridoxamine 5'-phosphate oxidase family protein n=1 Tax=Szabonella alba TaxID=2804194 RepID=A0A8K0XYQ5_9RHOB|nr:pyridoxamine 5'-phosphate oxidase family protein [Szabonella alba]MBL4915991.1 pyridoxamine 5'-phosphate oxidase family protein [Szabonella alba]
MLTDEIRADMAQAVLCWLATVDADGQPSVSPKEIFAPHGADRVMIAEIASAGSLRNIRQNPKVCVSLIDIFRQRGWKLTGQAEVIAPGEPHFADLGAEVLRMAGSAYPVRHLLSVKVQRAVPILAPSYRHFPDRSEAERVAEAHRLYGTRPASGG